MKDEDKTKDQLIAELVEMRQKVAILEASETQHQQTSSALKESEKRFCLVVEDVEDYAIFMLDTSGRFISWNAGVDRILGYSEAEFVGQQGDRIFTPEDRESGAPEQELSTAATEDRAMDERWHVRKDGTRFWASGVVTALRDETGILKGFSKVMRDFTERKLVEEERVQLLERERQARHDLERALLELHKSEARFRRIADSGIVGIVFSDVKGNITEANDAFLKMMGYTREELHKGLLHWDEMTPPEYLHLDERAIKELRNSGVCTPFEKEYIRKDGSRLPIVLGAALLEDSQENAACFVLDITKRKWAELALQAAVRSSRQYAAQLRGLTSASLAINSVHSLNEMLQTIAEQAREIIGAHQSVISMSSDENWTQVMEAVSFSDKHATRRQCKQTPDLFGIDTQVRCMQQPIRMTQAELVETRN